MPASGAARQDPTVVGRYAIFDRIGAGGMATVHVGRLVGGAGFSRTVAIKRLHAQFALDPDFVAMFVEEGRVASRIRHPNVVATFDVVAEEGELFMVMEYVEGEALAPIVRAANRLRRHTAPAVASAIMVDVLHGLHAAHTARTEQGEPLCIVHRDVSPQNVFVGTDGVGRVLDFGIAKAMGGSRTTREGSLKGKLGYMSPEHIAGTEVSPRSDVFGASIVLWELLTGRHLFQGDGEAALLKAVQEQKIVSPADINPEVSKALEAVVMKGLEREPERRFATAAEMADALELAVTPANRRAVGEWVQGLVGETLERRRLLVEAVEAASLSSLGALSVRSGVRQKPAPLLPEDLTFVDPPRSEHPPIEATTQIRTRIRPDVRMLAAAGVVLVFVVGLVVWIASLLSAPSANEIAPATATLPKTSTEAVAAPIPPPAAAPTSDPVVVDTAPDGTITRTPLRRASPPPAPTLVTPAAAPRSKPATPPRAKETTSPTPSPTPPKSGGIYSRE